MGDSELPHKATRTDTPTGQSLLELAIRCGAQVGDVLLTSPRLPPHWNPDRDGLPRVFWRERPVHLCEPETPMIDVIQDALTRIRTITTTHTHWVLAQPTTPDRTPDDLRHALEHYHKGVLATIEEVPAHSRPTLLRYQQPNGELIPVSTESTPFTRQDARKAYRRNGLAYVGSIDTGWNYHTPLYGLETRHVLTIDSQEDWDAWTLRKAG